MPSIALKHFSDPVPGEKLGTSKYSCKICSSTFITVGKTTSNLLTHLRRKHRDVDLETPAKGATSTMKPSTQSVLPFVEVQKSQTKWSAHHAKQHAITQKLVSMIAVDLLPLSIVESNSFRELIAEIEPRFVMPSRKHLSTKLIPAKYDRMHNELCAKLSETSSICITMDLWSNRQMRAYLGITAHYIQDFTLHTSLLTCERFRGSHTGERILQAYDGITSEFGVNNKVSFGVTDNASNMLKTFRLMDVADNGTENSPDSDEDQDSVDAIDISEQLGSILTEHFGCLPHTIQRILVDAFKKAEHYVKLLSRLSRFVGSIRSSTSATDLLEGVRRLQQCNATRWNSQLAMLRSILDIPSDVMDQLDHPNKPQQRDIKMIKDLVEILEPFETATNVLQGNGVTSSSVLPVTRGLCAQTKELTKKFKSQFVQALHTATEKRLAKYNNETFQLAAALDPRYKLRPIPEASRTVVRDELCSQLKRKHPDLCEDAARQQEDSPPPPKRSRLFAFMDEEDAAAAARPAHRLREQVETYLAEPCLPEDQNPLDFWKLHQHIYPQLADLACHYLQIPASSAAVERIFSIAGKTFRPDRCNLSDQKFKELMFIACNLSKCNRF